VQLSAILAAARHQRGSVGQPTTGRSTGNARQHPCAAGSETSQGIDQPFSPTWAPLIDQPDRVAGLASYRAATVMLLKRSLRNGSASVEGG